MTTKANPTHDSKRTRFKGSLAGTLVQTLLIFTFIPLALMAGAAYFRTRALLEEQAVTQSGNLLSTQIQIIDREITKKENHFNRLLGSSDFTILVELALHANPKSNEFREIRDGIIREFNDPGAQGETPSFDQFLLLDPAGNIKISSNAAWQGLTLNPSLFENTSTEHHSVSLYGLSPLYENEFILVTAQEYQTARGSTLGMIVGITEKKKLLELIQPLRGFSSLAATYFVLPNQTIISNNPETGEFVPAAPPSQDSINSTFAELAQKENPSPQKLDVKTTDGGAAIAQLQWLPKMGAGIVLEVKTADIYEQISSLIPFTSGLILVALLATVVVVLVTINYVVKPLRNLSEITREFADGDWSRRASITSSNEIGVLANSFNQMADQLGELYRSLEQKVDESERHIRATAEIAQNITTDSDLDETLDKTVELIVRQFGYYQASIFLADRGGKYVEFKTGCGAATEDLARRKYRLEVNSTSTIGWVCENNQPRIVSDVQEDPIHLDAKRELLPETRSEACMPISIGSLVLGVLDVQSTEAGAFNPEVVNTLQTLSSQIARAIQTAGLAETSQVNFEEFARLYRASRLVAKANSEFEVLEMGSHILKEAPYPVIVFHVQGRKLEVFSSTDSAKDKELPPLVFSQASEANIEEIENYLRHGEMLATPNDEDLPAAFKDVMQTLGFDSAACLPVRKGGELYAILMIGGQNQDAMARKASAVVQPYINLADLMSITMEKAEAIQQTERHLREVEMLASITEAISTSSDLHDFFMSLLGKVQQVIGDYCLMVALYDKRSDTLSFPFNYEEGRITSLDSFPLGDGLTSILIRTQQPLMIVENAEERMAELGARITGKPARSWMGVPMLVHNEPIGALILQDLENDHAFNEENLRFFSTIAGQVAGVIHNIHLLEESQHRNLQLENAAEIARDISGSLNLDELLVKAVNFIHKRLGFYHAAVFLHDLQGEYTVIREATGETGSQMKRAGYKIGVGSKSIVGYVSSKGEQLVVDNTARDATYESNPLFPNTRSEAAFPLKVGERILGEIDVHSAEAYAFTEDKLRSIQILADQMAVAVVNSELFSETQEHLSQHRLLHHITSSAASGTTLEEALETAVKGLQVTLGGDRVAILLTNREKNILEPKATTGYASDAARFEVHIGEGITGWVASHKRPLRIKDVREDPRYVLVSANTRSELAIPLVYRNELLGVLNVESEVVDAYNENDEEMLGTLGGSLAAIIANTRLLEQIRMKSERDRLIYDITTKIRRSTDIHSIMVTTTNELARLSGAQYAKIQIKPVDEMKKDGGQ